MLFLSVLKYHNKMKSIFNFLFLLQLIFSVEVYSQSSKNHIPNWVNNAIFYEIYPQTFYDTDADGIGDLKGVIQKLDYVKSLGVNAIWLNPFYESPFRDAGYDVSDYYKVAARYGTNEDAKNLFEEAHKRGLRVIVDFVPGHTSIDHKWFQEASKAEKNKYTNWYIWTNSTWQDPGKDRGRGFISGYSEKDANYMINFFWHQPALNFGFGEPTQNWQLPTNHPDILALREEMKNIMRFWLDMGCDGFRVDMAGSIIRKDKNGEGFKFWQEVKSMLDKDYPQAFMVSEWSHPKDAIKAGFNADFLHWVQEYDDLFRKEASRSLNNVSGDGNSFFDAEGKGDIVEFLKAFNSHYDTIKGNGYISIPVGNHDLSRINVNRNDDDLEVIYAFMMTMPNIPFFYYGDEIGMKQVFGNKSIEGCYPPRSGARTPMQWSSEKNLGFSAADKSKLWLGIDTSTAAPNVQSQLNQPNSLLSKTKKLFLVKRNEIALRADADFKIIYAEKNKYPFVFMREMAGEKIIVVLNPSNQEFSMDIDIKPSKKTIQLLGNKTTLTPTKTNFKLNTKGVSYGVFKLL